jgi:hypothetical protein
MHLQWDLAASADNIAAIGSFAAGAVQIGAAFIGA